MGKEGFIADFVLINTKIKRTNEILETTFYSEINDFFFNHIGNSENKSSELGEYGINVFNLKVGDILEIFPTDYSKEFSVNRGVPLCDDYKKKHKVCDIEIKYHTKNPSHEHEVPKLEVNIILEAV